MQEPERLISPIEQFEKLLDESAVRDMAEIAQPLDDWCEFCGERLATMKTGDGVPACADCAEQVLVALKKYADEDAEAEAYLASFKAGPYFTNRSMQRQAHRQMRRRNDGMPWGGVRTGSRCR